MGHSGNTGYGNKHEGLYLYMGRLMGKNDLNYGIFGKHITIKTTT